MSKLTVDGELSKELSAIPSEIQMFDNNGKLLGYFCPANVREKQLYAEAAALFDVDELASSLAEPGRSTTAEVLRRLVQN